MMVSQGRDGYPGAGPSKGLLGPEAKAKARTYHYLQVRLWWGGEQAPQPSPLLSPWGLWKGLNGSQLFP